MSAKTCGCGAPACFRVKVSKLISATDTIGTQMKLEHYCTSCLSWNRNVDLDPPGWVPRVADRNTPEGPTTPRLDTTRPSPVPQCSAHGLQIPCAECETQKVQRHAELYGAGYQVGLKSVDVNSLKGLSPVLHQGEGVASVPVVVKPLPKEVDPVAREFLKPSVSIIVPNEFQANCDHNFPAIAGVPRCSKCGWTP